MRRSIRARWGGRAIDLEHLALHAVVRLRNAGRAERVRLDDVRAGREVFVVNRPNDLRLREDEQVVVALQVMRVVVEAPAEVRLRQLALLDHRLHRAIHDQDALAHEARQEDRAVGLHEGPFDGLSKNDVFTATC